MTKTQLAEILKKVTYKPECTLKVSIEDFDKVKFLVISDVPDSDDPKTNVKTAVSIIINALEMENEDEVLLMVQELFIRYERHEVHEWFRYDGVRFENPH